MAESYDEINNYTESISPERQEAFEMLDLTIRDLLEEHTDAWRDLGVRPQNLPDKSFIPLTRALYLRRGGERYDITFNISVAEPEAPVKIVSLYQVDDSRGGQRMRGWYKQEFGTGLLWGYQEDAVAMGHAQKMTDKVQSHNGDLDALEAAAMASVFVQKWAEYAKQMAVRPEHATQAEIDEALQIIRESEVITSSNSGV